MRSIAESVRFFGTSSEVHAVVVEEADVFSGPLDAQEVIVE